VTVRSCSKDLFPGVRIGWLHAGPALLPALAAMKRYTDLETTPFLQAALVELIRDGSLDRHLAFVRGELRRRHAAAQKALREHAPAGWSWTEPDGGFALWLEGPPGTDSVEVARRAAARGVLVTPGKMFVPAGCDSTGFRFSLSCTAPEQVRAGIAEFFAGARVERARGDRQPLFL
jgi:2-aminoadipate transaminase